MQLSQCGDSIVGLFAKAMRDALLSYDSEQHAGGLLSKSTTHLYTLLAIKTRTMVMNF
jgi:hypothetical protein